MSSSVAVRLNAKAHPARTNARSGSSDVTLDLFIARTHVAKLCTARVTTSVCSIEIPKTIPCTVLRKLDIFNFWSMPFKILLSNMIRHWGTRSGDVISCVNSSPARAPNSGSPAAVCFFSLSFNHLTTSACTFLTTERSTLPRSGRLRDRHLHKITVNIVDK